MKRCPQCQFIYPDTDEICDFDQTTLALVAEDDIDPNAHVVEKQALAALAKAHSSAINKRLGRKGLPLAVASGLTIGMVVFASYFRLNHPVTPAPRVVAPVPAPIATPTPQTEPSPLPTLEASPEPSPTVTPKAAPSPKISTAHSSAGAGPVSTGNESSDKRSGAKPVILLNTGGRVEADEVWQTKDGVWYRANGVVTLLKRNRVKSVVRR